MVEAHLPFEPGALIAGKYRVGAVIASGGMGVIAIGHHEALDQRVAIKFLRPEATLHTEAMERFQREARAAAKIKSDHVVRVFDVGVHDDAPFMVMEHLEGKDLSDVAHERGPLPIADALRYVLEALEAIAEAHRLGIVHRDLKPSNLFLSRERGKDRIKVLDFGISKLHAAGAEPDLRALTSTKSLLGSPGYMSPEQVRSSRGVDARTDVWSMGVILYELLTGAPAYAGESVGDIFAKIREEPLPPIRTVRPDVSEELEAVLLRCLSKDRDSRYADGAELFDALLPLAPSAAGMPPPRRDSARVRMSNADTLPISSLSGRDAAEPRGSEPKRASTLQTWTGSSRQASSKRVWLGAGAIGLGCLVGAGWFASRPEQASSPGATVLVEAPSARPAGDPIQIAPAKPGAADATTTVTPAESAPPPPSASPSSSAKKPARGPLDAAAKPSGAPRVEPPEPEPPKASPTWTFSVPELGKPPVKKDDLGI